MKIDFNQQMKSLNGELLKDQIPVSLPNGSRTIKEGDPLTLKLVCINSLLNASDEEEQKKQTAQDKLAIYDLSMKINKAEGELDITSEEISKLKEAIAKRYTSFVYGQAHYMLEGGYAENSPVAEKGK